MAHYPTGTVTFLFTDIEGSTKLAREHPERWENARARHHKLLRGSIEANQGFVSQIIGDAFCAAFHKAGDALRAAVEAQKELQNEPWDGCVIRVRMGIHTGEAEHYDGEYQGYLTLSLLQRLMSAGHGGQILISNVTENLLRGQLPEHLSLRDMGEHKFKDVPYPVRVFQVLAPHLQQEFPALRARDAFPNNLPSQLTSFVGRGQQIREIKRAMSAHRLVTLTGVGGTGKTRLSLQVASGLLDQFPDGVWLIDLAGLTDTAFIPQTILSSLRVPEQPGLTILQLLEDYLRERRVLLVMDNCEHLIQGCARIVNTLLSKCPSLHVLATSREPLGVGGELIRPIPSLSLPDPKRPPVIEQLSQCESVRLFIERASLVQPNFLITDTNAPAIAQICLRLDGIPLAIELAAARVRSLSVNQIAERLDDRFRLLTGGSRTVLERHQTLRAAVDWSYNLLSPKEQLLLRRLSVFSGGWTLDATEQVCAGQSDISPDEMLELLTRLVDKSLISLDNSRYIILEITRQYAREKLLESGESQILRDRHLTFYMSLAEQIEPKLRTSERVQWMEAVQPEADNFRAALDWSLSGSTHGNAEKSLQLVITLAPFWQAVGSLHEGRTWLEKALEMSPGDSPQFVMLRGRARHSAGHLAWFHGDYTAARSQLEESLAIYRENEHTNKQDLAAALHMLAVTRAEDDLPLARSLAEESVALCRSRGSPGNWDLALALFWNGEIASRQYDLETARRCVEESLNLFRQAEDIFQSCGPLYVLAGILVEQGKIAAARQLRGMFAYLAGGRKSMGHCSCDTCSWSIRSCCGRLYSSHPAA